MYGNRLTSFIYLYHITHVDIKEIFTNFEIFFPFVVQQNQEIMQRNGISGQYLAFSKGEKAGLELFTSLSIQEIPC
jgi:hypothetical protein